MSRTEWRTRTSTDSAIYEDMIARAKYMRQNPTPAEKALWQRLRRKQLMGYRFRRQHPIDRFIVDLYCREADLVIEVDGPIHGLPELQEYDAQRTGFLEELGFTALRFRNEQVLFDMDSVLQEIASYLNSVSTPKKRS